uniref:Putative adenylate kinase n=1 Tax=Ignisphaera aggregans TaxID=334771 RepID=A0A7C4H765_9CREN
MGVKLKCIGISGTPGTGKTSIARTLSQVLNIPYLDLSSYVVNNKLYTYYDEERNSYVIDEDKVRASVINMYREKGPMIISSHYIEIIPRDIFEIVFILRRNPLELIDVLTSRGWPSHKIAENVEAELLSICTLNVIDEFGDDIVVEIDVSSKSLDDVVQEIVDILHKSKTSSRGISIDWTTTLSEKDLEKVLKFIEKYKP